MNLQRLHSPPLLKALSLEVFLQYDSFVGFASIVLDVALDKTLDYGITEEQKPLMHLGCRVEVPVRGHPRAGYVVEIKERSPYPSIKPIIRVISNKQWISPDLFQLALWISRYYCTPLRNIFRMLLPPPIRKGMAYKEQLFVMRGKTREELREICVALRLKKPTQAAVLEAILPVKKGILLSQLLDKTQASRSTVNTLTRQGLLILDTVRIDRSPLINEEYFITKPKKLNSYQAEALSKIEKSLDNQIFETHLLFGVTGSGKTEVYMQAIDKALKADKGTILLVPKSL